jgi:hypothetical protein
LAFLLGDSSTAVSTLDISQRPQTFGRAHDLEDAARIVRLTAVASSVGAYFAYARADVSAMIERRRPIVQGSMSLSAAPRICSVTHGARYVDLVR